MNGKPKILILADEPTLIADMLMELEDRGFDVVPKCRDDNERAWPPLDGITAVIIDLHQPDRAVHDFAGRVADAGIPILSLDGTLDDRALSVVRLSKPVNYERLHHFLRTFSERRPPAGRKPGGGGSIPFSDSMPAEKS